MSSASSTVTTSTADSRPAAAFSAASASVNPSRWPPIQPLLHGVRDREADQRRPAAEHRRLGLLDQVDRPGEHDQQRRQHAQPERRPALVLLHAHPIEPDRRQRERAQQTERVHVAEQRHLPARHQHHHRRNGDRDDDRPVRRAVALVALRQPARHVAEPHQRQEDVVAADERGVGGADQQRRRRDHDRDGQRARAERGAQLVQELVGVGARGVQQRGLERR